MAESRGKSSPDVFKDVRCQTVQYYQKESNDYHGKSQVTELEWRDYCPEIFRNILERANVNHADYMMTLCAKHILVEVSQPGKPGRVIIVPSVQGFVIKTLKKSETKLLLEIIHGYYRHITKNQSTELIQLYGLHSVKQLGGLKVYFVVLDRIIPNDFNAFGVYHLKGSSKGRNLHRMRVDEYIVNKDADFGYRFYINPLVRENLLKQIKIDCEFLELHGIIEYSFLIFLAQQTLYTGSIDSRICNNNITPSASPSFSSPPSPAPSTDNETRPTYPSQEFEDSQSRLAEACQVPDSGAYKSVRCLPARAVRTIITETGEEQESYNVVLCFKISDFFQKFDVIKRIEHIYKSIQYDSKSISAVKPSDYSSRLQNYLEQIFLPEDSMNFGSCRWSRDVSGESPR